MTVDQVIADILFNPTGSPDEVESLLTWSDSFNILGNFYEYIQLAGGMIEPRLYWESLAQAYRGSDNTYRHATQIKELFTADIPGREYLMTEEEREAFRSLPDMVTIYRGMTQQEADRDPQFYGVSWTLNREVAEFFTTYWRNFDTAKLPKTVKALTIPKAEIIAYFCGREEQEIIYIPNQWKP